MMLVIHYFRLYNVLNFLVVGAINKIFGYDWERQGLLTPEDQSKLEAGVLYHRDYFIIAMCMITIVLFFLCFYTGVPLLLKVVIMVWFFLWFLSETIEVAINDFWELDMFVDKMILTLLYYTVHGECESVKLLYAVLNVRLT